MPSEDDGSRDNPLLSERPREVSGSRPDVAALAATPTRIVIAVAEESAGIFRRTHLGGHRRTTRPAGDHVPQPWRWVRRRRIRLRRPARSLRPPAARSPRPRTTDTAVGATVCPRSTESPGGHSRTSARKFSKRCQRSRTRYPDRRSVASRCALNLERASPCVLVRMPPAHGVSMTPSHPSMKVLAEGQVLDKVGAGDEIRTCDIQLGKVAFFIRVEIGPVLNSRGAKLTTLSALGAGASRNHVS